MTSALFIRMAFKAADGGMNAAHADIDFNTKIVAQDSRKQSLMHIHMASKPSRNLHRDTARAMCGYGSSSTITHLSR